MEKSAWEFNQNLSALKPDRVLTRRTTKFESE